MRDARLLRAGNTFTFSKPAFFLLLAVVILAGILAVATVDHIDRGLQLMKLSFLRQGTTMISSFEAGARTSMMFRRAIGHNPLVDLATEVLKDTGIAYIRIIDEKGTVLVAEGTIPQNMVENAADMAGIGTRPVSSINWEEGIFEVTKEFQPITVMTKGMSMMEMRWEQWHMAHKPQGRMFISVGFYTHEFEKARKEDMHHTLFMTVMLLLLFAAGLYFLYLYRQMRITHATLLNTRLQLERSRRLAALGSMATGIAHEVRNPLGTLRGFAQFFGAETGASEACKKYAHIMIGEVDRLNQLVSELLQFGAPRELVFEEVDVGILFTRIATLLDGDFKAKRISFSCIRGDDVRLRGDADQLIQVILNLLKNSIRATPAGGTIALECFMVGSDCRISVRDSGQGMSEETQNKMFDPFFTTSKDGTGLGLAVCHQIVEQHHGRFEVTSKLGQGTAVVIVLPQEKKNGEETREKN